MQVGNALAIAASSLVALACRRIAVAALLAIAGGSAYGLGIVAKLVVDRPRPAVLLTNVHIRFGSAVTGNGFPSGHAAVAVGLAAVTIFAFVHRRRWVAAGLA